MKNGREVQLLESELLELIKVTGFKPYDKMSFFNYFAISLKEQVSDKYPRIFKCSYITFFISLIINITIIKIYPYGVSVKYLEIVRFLLLLVSSGCLSFLFANSLYPILKSFIYLISNRYIIFGALSDIVGFVMIAIALSVAFVASIDPMMKISYGIVKSIVIKLQLDPFISFPLFIDILVASIMFMILSILQKMIIPSNIKIKATIYYILYFINLLIVYAYLSKVFLEYIDLDLLVLKGQHYYDIFCCIVGLVSINYFFISFYTKINNSYYNINLNKLYLRLT